MLKLIVKETFVFASGKYFVVAGDILEGTFKRGMALQDSKSELFKIDGVNFGPVGSKIGLSFKFECDEEIETLRMAFPADQIVCFQ